MAVRVTYNEPEFYRVFRSPTGPYGRHMQDIVRQVANVARQQAPVQDGFLRASIATSVELRGGKMIGTVYSSLEYAIYVHEGTGLYGPRRAVIRPRRARALVFKLQGGPTVFAAYTRGQRPQRFLVDALRAVLPSARIS